jgi:hypothetical protein
METAWKQPLEFATFLVGETAEVKNRQFSSVPTTTASRKFPSSSVKPWKQLIRHHEA